MPAAKPSTRAVPEAPGPPKLTSSAPPSAEPVERTRLTARLMRPSAGAS